MPTHENTASRRRFFRRGLELGGALAAAPAVSLAMAPPENAVLTTIQSLRSIHGDFSDRRVPDEQVEAVLDACVRAANASNMQSYSIVVSREPAKIKSLTTYSGNCLLLFCADYNRHMDVAKLMGYEYHPDNMEAFVTSSTNTILAAQTAVIAAKSMGIDSLLTNGIHRGDMERVWTILDLPQRGCVPLIALILGYPKSEPAHKTGRLRGPGVVHYERYHHATEQEMGAIILKHDDAASGLALNDTWRTKYKHYLDWFYNDWAGGRKATTAEGPTFKRLKKSGFLDAQGA